MNQNVRVIKDGYSNIEDVLAYANVAEKYTTSVPNITVSGFTFNDMIKEIKGVYDNVQISITPNRHFVVIYDEAFKTVNNNVCLCLY